MRRAGPLRERWNFATERGVVHLVKENPEESGSLAGRIWLELGVYLDDEGRSDGGEQTGLRPKSARVHPSNVDDIRISVSCSSPRHTS
jgi:hypothetical protein